VLVVLVPLAWSYGQALTKPGSDGLGIRTVEWFRDHGAQGLVARVERAWYTHHAPPKGGLPKRLPTVLPPSVSASASPAPEAAATPSPASSVPSPVHLLVTAPVAGEGVWKPTGRTVDGAPVLYTTFMRPDNEHTSLVTGLAWIDTSRVKFELWSGAVEPGGSGWTQQAPIPEGQRPDLIAAFNSGFKMSNGDSRGGYLAEGRLVRPLVDGKASLVFFADGHADVAQWGPNVSTAAGIVGVRQNLVLLVDRGQPAANLDQDSLSRWGWTVGNRTLVWRSGVGVDDAGHLLYAAGNGLSVASLANVLLAAGAVRAMELDINSTWVNFFSYHDDATWPGGTGAAKLLDDMRSPADKYFHQSSRDFVAVFTRKPASTRVN
jgi:hypothetical protein